MGVAGSSETIPIYSSTHYYIPQDIILMIGLDSSVKSRPGRFHYLWGNEKAMPSNQDILSQDIKTH
jgi:hypothetical protein